ncbi:hypothetical protein DFH27DRAFT_306749 [Peziza echinospora]|nr:hypothetical protein DFH27DRAFT_306749 [Peziza echinospora]
MDLTGCGCGSGLTPWPHIIAWVLFFFVGQHFWHFKTGATCGSASCKDVCPISHRCTGTACTVSSIAMPRPWPLIGSPIYPACKKVTGTATMTGHLLDKASVLDHRRYLVQYFALPPQFVFVEIPMYHGHQNGNSRFPVDAHPWKEINLRSKGQINTHLS